MSEKSVDELLLEGMVAAQTGRVPPSYERDLKALVAALRQWRDEHPAAVLRWRTGNAPLAVDLTDPGALSALCASDDARTMLIWADVESGRRATALMARVALEAIGEVPREEDEGGRSSN